MNVPLFSNLINLPDLAALLGTIALIGGGAALIASSVPMRAELLARRVNSIRPQSSAAVSNAARKPPSAVVERQPSFRAGLSSAEQRAVVRLLSHINVPSHRAIYYFAAARLVVAMSASALSLAAARHFPILAGSWWALIMAASAGALAGWILLGLLIGFEAERRIKAAAAGLPDALELLVVCVEAGLSLEDGLQRVAHELRESRPAIADELALTWAEINIMPNRAQALANLALRVDAASVRSVVGMLSQSMRFGTPLAQSLRVGASEMRNEQMMALEEQASRLPAMLTIPVMVFIMPTIFLIIGGPAAFRLIDMFQNRLH
jgi:tight adherence protein C